ncbi:MAG: prohibitin family protein [Ruminococcus callidus]
MHLKVPFAQQIVMMNNKIQKTEIDSNGVSKDLQTVSSGVAINYHINKDDSAKIYQSIGEGYADTVLQPAIQESMKAITAQYTAEELITKRSAVGEEIGATLAEKVQEYGILIDKFNIINFDFSEEFNAAIEQKQVAEQNKLRAETERNRRSLKHGQMPNKGDRRQGGRQMPFGKRQRQKPRQMKRSTRSLNENVLRVPADRKVGTANTPMWFPRIPRFWWTLLPAEPLRHNRQKTRENNGSGRASLLCRFCIDRREEH